MYLHNHHCRNIFPSPISAETIVFIVTVSVHMCLWFMKLISQHRFGHAVPVANVTTDCTIYNCADTIQNELISLLIQLHYLLNRLKFSITVRKVKLDNLPAVSGRTSTNTYITIVDYSSSITSLRLAYNIHHVFRLQHVPAECRHV